MTQTVKIVCGTQRAYDKEIEHRKARGWQIVSSEVKPRGMATKLMVYTANLIREKLW